MSGPKQEVNQVSTTPEALGPAVGTAVETQQQLLPQQANLLQQLGGLILGGQAPGQQAFGQAQDFISQAAGLAGGAQGLQGGAQSILEQFGGGGGGGIGGGGLTRSGSGDILGLAQQFLQQGAQATQPAFDLASQQAFGQLRQFAPNISSTAFQEQGIDLGSRLGAQRQAQLNQLFTQGGQFGVQDLASRRGLAGQRAGARAQLGSARLGLQGQLAGLQNQRDIFSAGFPLQQAGLLGGLGSQLGGIGSQAQQLFQQLLSTTAGTVQGQTNFGRPFPDENIVTQSGGGFGNFLGGILGQATGAFNPFGQLAGLLGNKGAQDPNRRVVT